MNYLLTIKSLYAINGVVAVLLYIPQIISACKNKQNAFSVSLVTFGGWAVGSLSPPSMRGPSSKTRCSPL